LSAIHLAGLELAAGRCDVAVTGGVDTFNDIFMFMCFSKTPALSRTGDAKPFDANGDGTILGEGLGIVVLKRLADAERDGDRIYAVLKAIGSSSDGKGNAVYAPSASGQMRCLKNAYELAGISPATIELIEAHGTGTKVGDTVEASALAQVFREAKPEGSWCAVGSVKSMIGHTKAAAGAAGLIKAALALYNKVLPPTIKVKQPVEPLEPGKSPLYVNTEKRPWVSHSKHPRRAGMSAFGFGGSNFHAVLEENGSKKVAPDWDGRVQIVTFTGESVADVSRQLFAWPAKQTWSEFCTRAAETRTTFGAKANCRLILIAERDGDFSKLVSVARSKLDAEPAGKFWTIPEGAYFGQGPAAGSLGVLFPGQGSQSVGMLRDLACTFPEMLDSLEAANAGWMQSERLSDLIYPHPAFTPAARGDQEKKLRSTDVAQPALGAVELGAWQTLQRFGIRADALVGHSYGELVALCAAGVYDAASLHRLSRERGRIMAELAGDHGGMLAVLAALDVVESILTAEALDLVIANHNSPTQYVLSGKTEEISRAEAAFQKQRVRFTRLPVAAAFHSSLVAAASVPFRAALSEVAFEKPKTPVFANRRGDRYPDDPAEAIDWLGEQLARPVEFVAQIDNMARTGVRTFLEVGPGAVLTRLAEATLKARPEIADWDCVAIDTSAGRRNGLSDLAHALARLAARGHFVDLTKWEAGQKYPLPNAKPGLTVPIVGANYVRPKSEPSANGKPAFPTHRRVEPVAPVPKRDLMPDQPKIPPPEPAPASGALAVTQQSLLAFQKMQEETAKLHKQFLDNQQAALATLQLLVAQQHALLAGQAPAALPPIQLPPVAPPAPSVAPPQVAVPVAPPPAAPVPLPLPPVSVDAVAPAAPKPAGKRIDSGAILLAVVAEKTGYPADMLGLDMALDADLGIDSIKRVEILSSLQEKIPDAPAVKPEHLGTLHTLRDIVKFLGAPEPEAQAKASESPSPALAAPAANADVAGTLLSVVAEKTGYPADMLGLEMALDADLGIDSIKRVEILSALQERIPDAPAVKPEHLGTLHTLGDIVAFLGSGPPISPTQEAPRPFESALTPGSAESERVLAAETASQFPTAFLPPEVIPAPAMVNAQLGSDRLVRRLIRTVPIDLHFERPRVRLDRFAPVWLIADPSSFTARLSQQFDAAGCRPQFIPWNDSPFAYQPTGLAGLVLVAPDDPGPPDLALRAFRWLKRAAPALSESARAGGSFFATVTKLDGMFGFGPLDSGRDPIHGSLGGLGKTAFHEWPKVACKAVDIDPNVLRHVPHILVEEILTAGPLEVGLSAKGRVTLELADAPAVAPAGESTVLYPGDVIVVTGGARGVTAESLFPLVRELKPKLVVLGRTPSDSQEPDWLAGLKDEAAIKNAVLARSDRPPTPKGVADECKRILASRDVKRNLARLREAGATVEYLNVDVQDGQALSETLAQVRQRLGPISALIHGAGVIADRKIEDLSEEQFQSVYATKVHGLQNLLTAAADDPLRAIVLFSSSTGRFGRTGQSAYAAANEVLNKTAQRLARQRPHCRTVAINWGPWEGGMVTPALASLFASEGIGLIRYADGGEAMLRELASADRPAEVVILAESGKPAEEKPAKAASSMTQLNLIFERTVALTDHPVLRSHFIGDKAVVPFVLHMEWMAHAAMHGYPGLKFHEFDDLRIYQGIHVEESAPAELRVFAGKATKRDGLFVVPVEIRGERKGREIAYSRAQIVLADRLTDAPFASPPPVTGPFAYSADDAYDFFLFHGPDLRAFERVDGMGDGGAIGFARVSPPPTAWMQNPVRGSWISDPLAVDAAFQLLSIWSYQRHRAASLPVFAGRFRQYRKSFPQDGVLIAARITHDVGATLSAPLEFNESDGPRVSKITHAEQVKEK
jgi:acyl transferase domain-containing protein/NAD(P)-dependent dehydrogenase (short-subunit alcohol dehydrogenase family)/acyl carrier protein